MMWSLLKKPETKSGEYPKINKSPRKDSSVKHTGKVFVRGILKNKKHVDHGIGYHTETSQYVTSNGPFNGPDEYSSHKSAHTKIMHIGDGGYNKEIGKIEHIKHQDGSETHTLKHRPINGSYSGGEVKSLKDAVNKTESSYKFHNNRNGYPIKDHGHSIVFKNPK